MTTTMAGTGADDTEAAVASADRLAGRLGAVRQQIGRVIFGQEQVVSEVLVCLLSGSHALLVGAPGLGKTLLVQTLGAVLGLESRRVQFTPDLMPADITGSEILDETQDGRRGFRFVPGPVFCQLLMADEINRASPRTQSALLQAMQEHRVAVAGLDRPLPHPFHVLATQNPIEQEGTYPLPEAQLDRFMLQIDLTYPAEREERAMLLATTGARLDTAEPVLAAGELVEAQALIRSLPVGERIVDSILRLVRSARPESSTDRKLARDVAWGPGPRAAQSLMLACRARAVLDGRLSPSIEDVAALAHPVLRHRMALTFAARAEGTTLAGLIDGLIQRLE